MTTSWSHLAVHPGEVEAGAALAAVPGHQHAGAEGLAHHVRHPANLAQQQGQLRVRHVVQDRSEVRDT